MECTDTFSEERKISRGTSLIAVGLVNTLRRYFIGFYQQFVSDCLGIPHIPKRSGFERIGLLAVVIFFAVTGSLQAEPIAGKPPLTVVSSGGAYTKSNMLADICPQSFSSKVSLTHCLGSYRDEPTISQTGLAPAGNLRLRGAPIDSVDF